MHAGGVQLADVTANVLPKPERVLGKVDSQAPLGLSKPGFTWLTSLLLTPGGLTLFFEHELPKKLSVCLEFRFFLSC